MPTNGVTEGRTQIANFSQFIDQFMKLVQSYGGDAAKAFSAVLDGSAPFLSDFQENTSALRNFRESLPGMFKLAPLPDEVTGYLNRYGEGMDRATQVMNNGGATANSLYLRDRLNEMLLGQTGTLDSLSKSANDTLARGGYTPNMTDLNGYVQQFMANGGFTASLSELQNVGEEILRTRGQTADSQATMKMMQDLIATGGQSAQTNGMFQQGQGLVSSGGMTPAMQQLFGKIMEGMQSGGMTPEARQVFGKAMSLVNSNGAGGALLPMEQVQGFARDEAATAAAGQIQAARRRALQRQGSSVMSGISEDTYGEFADQAMQAQAANVREATTDQQKLQLEQFLSALGISGDLTKAASALMGQYAGAGADLQRSASANIASGGDLMKAAESIALGRLQTGVSGANDVMRTELARLGLGGDLINQANQTALARANFGAGTMGNIESLAASNKQNALQTLLGVGGLQMGAGDAMTRLTAADNANMIQAMQTFSQLLNGAGGLFQGQQQLQQAQKFGQIDAFLKSMGLSGDFMNNYANWFQNSAAGLNNTAGLFAGAFPSLFGGYSNLSNSLIEAAMQPGFWERLAGQAVSGAAAGATGALGGWLGGGKKSSR